MKQKPRKKKSIPPLFDMATLAPFVEKDTELSKSDLISRCAGNVRYEVLQMVKLLQFFIIGKNENGELYLV